MDFLDSIMTAAGVSSTTMATLEMTGENTFRVDISGYPSVDLTVAEDDDARALADDWFLSQRWKRLTRWDPNTGPTSTCYILL